MIRKLELINDQEPFKGDLYTVYLFTPDSYSEICAIKDELGIVDNDGYSSQYNMQNFEYRRVASGPYVFGLVSDINEMEFSRVVGLMKHIGFSFEPMNFCKAILEF